MTMAAKHTLALYWKSGCVKVRGRTVRAGHFLAGDDDLLLSIDLCVD